jgi:hypothetical protein
MNVERKNIFLDILLTLITFGAWNLWVQVRQMLDVNEVLGRDEFSVVKTLIFSLLTFGLYFCYHEYKMTKDLQEKVYGQVDDTVALLSAIATFFALWFIVDSYQQSLLNLYVEKRG